MISISQKAGKVVTGEDACIKAITSGNGFLVIIAEDASDNTKKRFTNKAGFYGVPYVIAGLRDELSRAIGKLNRPTIVITDEGLSGKIISLVNEHGDSIQP